MMSPPDAMRHSRPHSDLSFLLRMYETLTSGVMALTDGGFAIPNRDASRASEVSPDAQLFIRPEHGGQRFWNDDGGIGGVPELVVEVANTSLVRDTTLKRAEYERAGVQEYLIYAVRERSLLALVRTADRFQPVDFSRDVFRSVTFPGLHLDGAALIASDMPAAMTTLQAGLATPEHGAFVAQLAARRENVDG